MKNDESGDEDDTPARGDGVKDTLGIVFNLSRHISLITRNKGSGQEARAAADANNWSRSFPRWRHCASLTSLPVRIIYYFSKIAFFYFKYDWNYYITKTWLPERAPFAVGKLSKRPALFQTVQFAAILNHSTSFRRTQFKFIKYNLLRVTKCNYRVNEKLNDTNINILKEWQLKE